jgi:hypothetical protein
MRVLCRVCKARAQALLAQEIRKVGIFRVSKETAKNSVLLHCCQTVRDRKHYFFSITFEEHSFLLLLLQLLLHHKC